MSEEQWQNPQINELNSPGDVVSGTYLGKKTNTVFKKDGDSFDKTIYQFIDEDGDEFEIGGTSSIDKQMLKIPNGAIVRIEYLKDVPTEKGNPFKLMKVQFKMSADAELSKTKAQEKREAVVAQKSAADYGVGDIIPMDKIAVMDEFVKSKGWSIDKSTGQVLPF